VPAAFVVVVKAWAMDEPLPLDAPDTPLSLTVQLNVVPAIVELKAIDVVCPVHIVWLDGVAIAEGMGPATVTTTVIEDPTQSLGEVGVIV